MWKWLSCLLTIAAAQATETPFWRSKEKVYARIRNREIVVSVVQRASTPGGPRQTLIASGGGQSSAPCDFIFAQSLRPQELAQASDYIKSSTFDPKTSRVDLQIEALGRSAALTVALLPFAEAVPRRLEFEIVKGPMTGFRGALSFTEISAKTCEVGLAAVYGFDQSPLPRSFLEFGLEVIFQRMAARLRAFVEEKNKAATAESAKGKNK